MRLKDVQFDLNYSVIARRSHTPAPAARSEQPLDCPNCSLAQAGPTGTLREAKVHKSCARQGCHAPAQKLKAGCSKHATQCTRGFCLRSSNAVCRTHAEVCKPGSKGRACIKRPPPRYDCMKKAVCMQHGMCMHGDTCVHNELRANEGVQM